MDYFEFRKTFELGLSKLKLPADCKLQEPEWTVLRVPLAWMVEVFFEFRDNNHIRIWESHDKFAGLYASRRISWSYHYGVITARDEEGHIIQGPADDPVEIRIDTCSGLHLHYQAQQPHYQQARVSGLDLNGVTALQFVKAVFKYRSSGKDFSRVFGFKLLP